MNFPRRSLSPDGDDLFNTSSAHVHIGPVKSPEKRFVLNLLKTNSPRRSLRLSSPDPLLEIAEEPAQDSRPHTPENDRLVDDDGKCYILVKAQS